MFGRIFLMDCKRCFRIGKISMIVLATIILTIANAWNYIQNTFQYPDSYDVVRCLGYVMKFDQYKVIMAFILGALYTASVCNDDDSKYLRMILSRVDITTYIQSRFLVNTLGIVVCSVASFLLCSLLLSIRLSLWEPESITVTYYYRAVLEFHPILYIIMMGFQFGMLVAACSSIGLLSSAYQCNSFVSVGLVGLSLFAGLSYLPMDTIVSIVGITSMMGSTALSMFPPAFNYAWGILYPTLVIVLCGYLFYRRMKWRMLNGFI